VRIVHTNGLQTVYTLGGTNAPAILEAGDLVSVPRRVF
jgi:hypothetical protein